MTSASRRSTVCYVIGFLIVFGLKLHYSRATVDDLKWILTPTAAFVEGCFGIPFEREAHAGAISREYGIILAPACAGVNFLIICFSTLWFSILHRIVGLKRQLVWLGVSAALSYLLTLVVNGLRIVVSIFLYRADIYGGWLTPDRVHRMEGTLLYCSVLLLIYPIGRKLAEWLNGLSSLKSEAPTTSANGLKPLALMLTIPLAWYGAVTIVTPLLNEAWRHNGWRFAEHCGFVAGTCAMLLLLSFFVVAGSRAIRSSIGQLGREGRNGVERCALTSPESRAAERESAT